MGPVGAAGEGQLPLCPPALGPQVSIHRKPGTGFVPPNCGAAGASEQAGLGWAELGRPLSLTSEVPGPLWTLEFSSVQ